MQQLHTSSGEQSARKFKNFKSDPSQKIGSKSLVKSFCSNGTAWQGNVSKRDNIKKKIHQFTYQATAQQSTTSVLRVRSAWNPWVDYPLYKFLQESFIARLCWVTVAPFDRLALWKQRGFGFVPFHDAYQLLTWWQWAFDLTGPPRAFYGCVRGWILDCWRSIWSRSSRMWAFSWHFIRRPTVGKNHWKH